MEKGKSTETSKLFTDISIKGGVEQQIVTNLDFRSERILLPKIVTSIANFNEDHEVIIKAQKGKVTLEKL